MHHTGIFAFLLIAAGAGAAFAADGAPADAEVAAGTGPVAVSLLDCIRTALEYNHGLITTRYDVDVARTAIEVERAAFDPAIDLNAMYEKQDRQTALTERLLPPFNPTFQINPQSQARTFGGGIGTYLPTGTTLRGETSHSRYSSNRLNSLAISQTGDDLAEYFSTYTFSLSQSLLRNLGPGANLAGLRTQELYAEQEAETYRGNVIDTVAKVEDAYWLLALIEDRLDNAYLALELAEDLLERNRQKVAAGTMSQVEVLVAEAEVASRRELVIQERNNLANSRDLLCLLMGLPEDDPRWDRGLVPDSAPRYQAVAPDFEESVVAALAHRPEVARADKAIAAAEISRQYAANQRLPDLTAFTAVTATGDERGSQDASNDTAVSGDYLDYSVGVTFSYPLSNRAARARYEAALLRRDQAIAARNELVYEIRVGIREAVREVMTTQEQIEAAGATVRVQEERLRMQSESQAVGLATSRDVLEAQEDLIRAKVRHSEALVSYLSALVALERRKGTLLEAHGLAIGPGNETAEPAVP